MREKIVLIGAGSAMFTRGVVTGLVARRWSAELVLVDVSETSLDVASKLARKIIDATGAPVAVSSTTNRREALRGATAVVCAIGVGGRSAWEQDVLIPRKYGIYQSVGDAVGPGGLSRIWRTVPVMIDIARDVVDVAPKAIFMCYTNPLPVVCDAVRRATGADIIGLCHGVPSTAGFLSQHLKVKSHSLNYTALGYNHFAFFTQADVRGTSVMQRLQRKAKKLRAKRETFPAEQDPFSWDLFAKTGCFPAHGDPHLCEFFPEMFSKGAYYGKTLGVDVFSFEQRLADGARIFEQMQAVANSPEPVSAEFINAAGGEHELALSFLAARRGGKPQTFTLSVPNNGHLPGMPRGSIVEAPCLVSAAGVKPIMQAPVPDTINAMLGHRFIWAERAVTAAIKQSRDEFIYALQQETPQLSPPDVVRMADELLAMNAKYMAK